MEAVAILAAIAGLPVLLALVFRVSAVYLFLSVAAGSLLVLYVGDDAGLASDIFMRSPHNTMIAQLVLQLLPVVLTLLILRKTMPATAFLLHVPVVIATGLALAVLTLPLLDAGLQDKISADQYGNMVRESQDVIVAAAASASLLLMLITSRRREDKKHKKHKK
jgi:hypothetical protein